MRSLHGRSCTLIMCTFIAMILVQKANLFRNTPLIINWTIRGTDSLKWMMYTINYEKKATHFRNNNLPEVSLLECDIKLTKKDLSRKDTIMFYFSFFKDGESNIYAPQSGYFYGIGFSYKNNNYFPISDGAFPRYIKDGYNYENFFEEQEREFIGYLKCYKGSLSKWLKQELSRRKIGNIPN